MFVLWAQRPTIAGWSLDEAALVTAWFTLLRAVLDGAVQPSLQAVVEHIRKGTLDFVLLKPADAQFLVSTARFEILQRRRRRGGVALGALGAASAAPRADARADRDRAAARRWRRRRCSTRWRSWSS